MSRSKFERVACMAILNDFVCGAEQDNPFGFAVEYIREKPVRTKHGTIGKVDMFLSFNRNGHITKFNFECKVNASNLLCGNGLNFEEEFNYLIYPRDCFSFACYGDGMDAQYVATVLDKMGYSYVGIICYEPDGELTVERTAKRHMPYSTCSVPQEA